MSKYEFNPYKNIVNKKRRDISEGNAVVHKA